MYIFYSHSVSSLFIMLVLQHRLVDHQIRHYAINQDSYFLKHDLLQFNADISLVLNNEKY